jgi:HSP20 family protein
MNIGGVPMDREKPVKKSTDVVPVSPGSSQVARRRQSLFEHDIDSIFDDFRKSFDVLMRPYYPVEMQLIEPAAFPVRYAPLDIIDEGTHFLIHAELPGFTRENVDVQISKEGMSIRAKKEEQKEEKKKNYLHRERAYSAFERALSFPEEVDPSKAEGSMKDGVLELRVPKKEPKPETRPRKIEIK